MELIIPCYNEAERLSIPALEALLADARFELRLVNDGSRDGTLALLESFRETHPARVRVLDLGVNSGKGEAVRRGLLAALAQGASEVGYLDADFATPPDEVKRLLDLFDSSGAKVVLGSRIARLGAEVERHPSRHYLGRMFATTASMILGLHVYDTQCGAKLFRDTPALRAALGTPFSSRWSFDVELLGRLTTDTPGSRGLTAQDLLEVPLDRWHDVRGSKLVGGAMIKAGGDVLALGAKVALRGRRAFFG